MKICAEDLLAFGICEKIIEEPEGGAAKDIPATAGSLREYLAGAVERFARVDTGTLLENRYRKFRKIGEFL